MRKNNRLKSENGCLKGGTLLKLVEVPDNAWDGRKFLKFRKKGDAIFQEIHKVHNRFSDGGHVNKAPYRNEAI